MVIQYSLTDTRESLIRKRNIVTIYEKKYAEYIDVCYILHTSDLKIEESFVFLPVYMVGFL